VGKLIVAEFISLDGYMVGPDEDMSWVIDGFVPEISDEVTAEMDACGTLLFGRVTYEIFAAYWPYAIPYEEGDEVHPAAGKEDPRLIRTLNERQKVVISRTMTDPGWQNVRVTAEPLEELIPQLTSAGDVMLQGSASLVQQLANLGLVDEYRLLVHPTIVAGGKQLFAGVTLRTPLEVVERRAYSNGAELVRYRRV
jgi:dihydrofolate reductase